MKGTDWAGWARSLLRMVAAFTFSEHGMQKVLGMFGGHGGRNAVLSGALLTVIGVLEMSGAALLLLGLFTRPAAFVLSGEMAFAYFRQHAPKGFWPIQNGGELAVLYCFLFLYLSLAGAGPLSIDALRRR